jgi:hypothetical protein
LPTPGVLSVIVAGGALDRIEEHAGEGFGIEGVGTCGKDELAELGDFAGFEVFLLILECFELGVDVTGLAHGVCSSRWSHVDWLVALEVSMPAAARQPLVVVEGGCRVACLGWSGSGANSAQIRRWCDVA